MKISRIKRSSVRIISEKLGWKKGWENGYPRGWSYGHHVGRCEAVMGQIPPDEALSWDIKLLYVATGLGFPFSPLDQAMIANLNSLVRELHVTDAMQNVVSLATEIRPDLVLVFNGNVFPIEQVDAIRALGIKTAVWFTDDPYWTDGTISIAPHYDYVFTLELSCVSFYQELGCQKVHYLPLAMDPNVYRPQRVDTSYHKDICFIGSAFWNRVSFFDQIASYLSDKKVMISGIWWDRMNNYSLLKNKIRLGVWMSPEDTARYYNGSKIVINLHRSYENDGYNGNSRNIPAFSPNPRLFEISGCGTLQLTDLRADIGRFYTPDYDIATYSSPEELIQKIEYYLSHENERREIALRALARTMNEHTYRKRLIQLLKTIYG